LEQRENAHETEFVHREDLKCRARERAVKALATWAAEHLGKTGDAAEEHVTDVIASGRRCARRQRVPHSQRAGEYLLGTPLVGDFLEEGLSMLGYSCEEYEIERL